MVAPDSDPSEDHPVRGMMDRLYEAVVRERAEVTRLRDYWKLSETTPRRQAPLRPVLACGSFVPYPNIPPV
jgi:hypothetical protein